MRDNATGFVAYPSTPVDIATQLKAAQTLLETDHRIQCLTLWEENDIAGRFLSTPILENLAGADFLVADITQLNFNVMYEVGYAIGKKKRILLIKNRAIKGDDELVRETGIFDTLGYKEYQNSRELADFILSIDDFAPLKFDESKVNRSTPVYLLLPRYRTDVETRLLSRIKKARLNFRSFDPEEQGRLSAAEAIDNVAHSLGVIAPLLPINRNEVRVHNLRAAFIAGLTEGMEKKLVLIQSGYDPVPLDYRDLVTTFTRLDHIDVCIAEFATEITGCLQGETVPVVREPRTFLASVTLGASAAENELSDLGKYYLETEEYRRTLSGEIQIVTGRKGSGKTALFAQVRDKLRYNKKNIVLDLKPEGFQLLKFRKVVLDLLEAGTREHTVTAFWEYLLLLEICHKILEKDKMPHLIDHNLFTLYRGLSQAYEYDAYVAEGDFAERMLKLTERISEEFQSALDKQAPEAQLVTDSITELLYKHDVADLRDRIVEYLKQKDSLWILFDNLDKGWPAQGVAPDDVLTLKCLLDALSKLQRTLIRNRIRAHGVIFVRNDVYEILIENTSDRGKVSRVSIDWSDADLLRELLRRRLNYSPDVEGQPQFADIWLQICVSHINGEESSQYLIDRCLMRPRSMIDLVQACKSRAVNLGHPKITAEDVAQGEEQYSTELVTNINFEMRDIYLGAGDVLYEFIGASYRLTQEEVERALDRAGIGDNERHKVADFLLWFGFLGVIRDNDEVAYIYSVKYDIKRLKGLIVHALGGKPVFQINQAFWAGLEIRH